LATGAIVLAVAGCFLGNGYQVYLIAIVALTTVIGAGLNVLLGLNGQVSLGHVGFFAIGAYATAILTTSLGLAFWVALPVSVALAGVVGVALALPALRVTGPYLAMITIAFGFIIENAAIEWRSLTGGANGMMNLPPPVVGAWEFQTRDIALLAVFCTVLVLLAFRRLDRSAWGRAMRAVRASETAAQASGLNPVSVRIVAFGLSAAAAGLAGGLFAPLSGFLSPSGFGFYQSILFLLVVIIGGAGSVLGPLAGAIVVVLLPELLGGLAEYRLLFFGSTLLLVLWGAPGGIVGELNRRLARAARTHAPEACCDIAAFLGKALDGAALEARRASIAFGGVRAVADVDFVAPAGKVTSLIGPNGAGKTTLLNLLSGYYRADSGAIALATQPLDSAAAHEIARAGVARTFQTSELFSGLSVLDNVRVGLRGNRLGIPFANGAGGPAVERERRLAESLLAFVGYRGAVERAAAELPHVDRRLVEIARALATGPQVLLLDEPATGLGQEEKERLRALLQRLSEIGLAVVLVEHDVGLVMDVSDTVVVLDAGRVIATGPPQEVQNDPAVIRAYLGETAFTATPRRKQAADGAAPLLEVRGLHAGYAGLSVLSGIELRVHQSELVAILGANGAGKSTTLRALSGLLRPVQGAIEFAGKEISTQPAHRIAWAGLVLVPEGRQIFPELSVIDNLRLGAFARAGRGIQGELEAMLARFPALRERHSHRAGLLSGGEQQMLALARGLMAAPRALLIDEPSLGLAPRAIANLFAVLAALREEGRTLLLVEQLAGLALALADRAYVLETGRIVHSGQAEEVARNATLETVYLGTKPANRFP
jgi:ABC-type branched-subunit amino acid transport system ATPase component/ABC-type branched-subunit amino acid transport system permease subunit